MGDISVLKGAKVVYAFPGHGKTPFVKYSLGSWMDLDFGLLREGFRVEKAKEYTLYKPYARLVKSFVDEGYKVLSNAPETIPFVQSLIGKGQIVMVLPVQTSFSARKLGVSEEQVRVWINDWHKIALKQGIPVLVTEHSLDVYMRGMLYQHIVR